MKCLDCRKKNLDKAQQSVKLKFLYCTLKLNSRYIMFSRKNLPIKATSQIVLVLAQDHYSIFSNWFHLYQSICFYNQLSRLTVITIKFADQQLILANKKNELEADFSLFGQFLVFILYICTNNINSRPPFRKCARVDT